jgi:hypothetical protein
MRGRDSAGAGSSETRELGQGVLDPGRNNFFPEVSAPSYYTLVDTIIFNQNFWILAEILKSVALAIY